MMKEIKVECIHPHPKNPRKNLGDLTELTDSIRTFGILQNLTVVPDGTEGYVVICGHRRLAAAEAAGLETVPCVIADNMDEKTQVSIMLLENMQRSDLTVQEEAQGLQMMLDLGASIADIVKETGLSETKVRHRVKMNELDQDLLGKKLAQQISINDLIKLEQIKDIGRRNEVLAAIGTNNFEWRMREAIKDEKKAGTIKLIKGYKPDVEFAPGYSWQYKTCGNLVFGADQNEVAQFMIELVDREKAEGKTAMIAESTGGSFCIAFEVDVKGQQEDPEERKKKEELSRRLNDLRDIQNTVELSWEEFIRDYCNKSEACIEKDQNVIMEELITGMDAWPDIEEVCAIMGVDTDEPEEENRLLQSRPWATLAAMAFTCVAPSSYEKTWSYSDGSYDERSAKAYIKTSYYLEELGYKVSDDEKDFIYGASEAYRKDK